MNQAESFKALGDEKRHAQLLERALPGLLEDALVGHGRLLVAGLGLGDADAEGLHDAHRVEAGAATDLVLEVLLLERVAPGGELLDRHLGIAVDDADRLVVREHRSQLGLRGDREADAHGMALAYRQQLVHGAGLLGHPLHLAHSLTRMNDVVSDLVH